MNPEETKPDITRGRAYMAAAIMVGHMMKHLYNSGFSKLILPEIKVVLNLSYSQFGWLGSAQALSWWLATMLGGYLGDRFTGRTAMFLGLTMVFIGFSQLGRRIRQQLLDTAGLHAADRRRACDVPPLRHR